MEVHPCGKFPSRVDVNLIKKKGNFNVVKVTLVISLYWGKSNGNTQDMLVSRKKGRKTLRGVEEVSQFSMHI